MGVGFKHRSCFLFGSSPNRAVTGERPKTFATVLCPSHTAP